MLNELFRVLGCMRAQQTQPSPYHGVKHASTTIFKVSLYHQRRHSESALELAKAFQVSTPGNYDELKINTDTNSCIQNSYLRSCKGLRRYNCNCQAIVKHLASNNWPPSFEQVNPQNRMQPILYPAQLLLKNSPRRSRVNYSLWHPFKGCMTLISWTDCMCLKDRRA